MPILILALVALAVFLSMGLMLFYAAYKEAHTPHATLGSAAKPGLH